MFFTTVTNSVTLVKFFFFFCRRFIWRVINLNTHMDYFKMGPEC